MPSNTFLNLLPEKQEKLLTAAIREFTERPYNEASINRIIRRAGIPRGSFYMYFRDKEELFRYLLRENVNETMVVFCDLLAERSGDVFAALPLMYDYLQAQRQEERTLGSLPVLSAVVNCNCGLQKSGLLEFIDADDIVKRMAGSVDPELLDLQCEKDLEHMLRMLLALAIPLMYNGLRPGGDPEGREKLTCVLEILRRGMGAKPVPAKQESGAYGAKPAGKVQ